MSFKRQIISELLSAAKPDWIRAESSWGDHVFLRACLVRLERGEAQAWIDFVQYVVERGNLANVATSILADLDYLRWDDTPAWVVDSFSRNELTLNTAMSDTPEGQEVADLLRGLVAASPPLKTSAGAQKRTKKTKSEIMYVEAKPDITGPARIGRVHFSQTGKTIYYRDRTFQSLKGGGHLSNYFDLENGERYWISGCRKDGLDALYPGIVEIDDDVREEYWTTVRKRPDLVKHKSFRSEGKYRR